MEIQLVCVKFVFCFSVLLFGTFYHLREVLIPMNSRQNSRTRHHLLQTSSPHLLNSVRRVRGYYDIVRRTT